MVKTVNRDKYSKLFKGKEKKALRTALDTRKFEIEMYWKRATYFWAFIAATIAGYFALLNSHIVDQYRWFTIFVAIIGFFFSVGWYFVNRGSKYWQENWEDHVSLLENEIQGPLFGCVKIPKDNFTKINGYYPFSVSKVNQLLSFVVVIFWFITFIFSIIYSFNLSCPIFNPLCCTIILIGLLVLSLILFFNYSLSFLRKKEYTHVSIKDDDLFFLKRTVNMNTKIKMGNDEFILYIRKKDKECSLTNDQLGKKIWEWIQRNDENASLIKEDDPCLWGDKIENKKGLGLPKTAAQFQFDRTLLPRLYEFLDTIL